MRDGVEPAREKIRVGVPDHIPRRGGYAGVIEADLDLRVSVSTTGKDPGVSMIGKTLSGQKRSLKRLDAGILRHPLFGDKESWFKQEKGVTPGFFTRPCQQAGPEVERNLAAALERVAYEVDSKAAGR
jgi:hypothetical protein